MKTSVIGYDKCLSFINCQITPQTRARPKATPSTQFRAVTVSRQTGSGAHAILEQLATTLQRGIGRGTRPWTVFDKTLVSQVLKDHHLPERMAECIPEDRRTELQDAVEEFFGLRPPSWTLIQHTTETVLRLVELGNVILVGRGATVVTRDNPEVLRVRFVASETTRAQRIAADRELGRKAALDLLRKEDRGRARYVKKYFETDIDEAELYHVTFNTDTIAPSRIVDVLATFVREGTGNA